MQNSKFLQFLSKMSRGELIIDDNQVKETALPASGDWAAEYRQQYNRSSAWADEFVCIQVYVWLMHSSNILQHCFAFLCICMYHFPMCTCAYKHTTTCVCI